MTAARADAGAAEPERESPFAGGWMGGYEGADPVNAGGEPLDLVAASGDLERLDEDHRRSTIGWTSPGFTACSTRSTRCTAGTSSRWAPTARARQGCTGAVAPPGPATGAAGAVAAAGLSGAAAALAPLAGARRAATRARGLRGRAAGDRGLPVAGPVGSGAVRRDGVADWAGLADQLHRALARAAGMQDAAAGPRGQGGATRVH